MFEWGYLPPRKDQRPNQHRLTPEQMEEGRIKGRKSSKGKLRGDAAYYRALRALRRTYSTKGVEAANQWKKDNPEEFSRRVSKAMKTAIHKSWATRKINRAIELRGDSKAYKRPPRVELKKKNSSPPPSRVSPPREGGNPSENKAVDKA